MIKVSIIIPTYNREEYISETLNSIISQSTGDWEIIVVDDGSTDSTLDVIKKYLDLDSRIKLFVRPSNLKKGANSCRNLGFIKSRGKYIKFLDSDDLLKPNTLFEQISIMDNNERINVCLSYGRFFNNRTKELEEFWSRNKSHENFLLGHIKNDIRWAISDPLWRKSFFKNPPFNEDLKNSQEWLMHSESFIKLRDQEIFNMQETYSLIRRGNKRMSANKSSNYYKNQKLARKFLLIKLLSVRHLNLNIYIELIKQIIVYYYWELKSKYF